MWIYWVSKWDGDIKEINDFPFQLVLLMFERSKRKKAAETAAVTWVESINKEINYCLKHFDKFRNWMRNWTVGNEMGLFWGFYALVVTIVVEFTRFWTNILIFTILYS